MLESGPTKFGATLTPGKSRAPTLLNDVRNTTGNYHSYNTDTEVFLLQCQCYKMFVHTMYVFVPLTMVSEIYAKKPVMTIFVGVPSRYFKFIRFKNCKSAKG